MKLDIRKIFIGMSAFICYTLCSPKTREMFYGHTIYYSLSILFIFTGLFLLLHLKELAKRYRERPSRSLKIRCLIALAALCSFVMLTASDGLSCIAVFALPLTAALTAERLLDTKSRLLSRDSVKIYALSGVLLLMIYLGVKLLGILQGDVTAGYADAYSAFSGKSTWLDNFMKLPDAWLSMFGVEDLSGKGFGEPESILCIIRILGAALFAVMPIFMTLHYKRLSEALRLLLLIHWCVSAVILLGYICGGLSAANWRLIPMMSTSVAVTVIFMLNGIDPKLSAGRITLLASAAAAAFFLVSLQGSRTLPTDNFRQNILFDLTQTLEDEDLTYGYASYWNANSITVISGEQVKVRDVMISESSVNPGFLNNDRKWYKDREGQRDYFLLMNDAEYNTLKTGGQMYFRSAKRELALEINGAIYHILVFDSNIIH